MRPEVRGFIGKNGHGQVCFFTSSWAEGVPVPDTTNEHDGVAALLTAIALAPVRAPLTHELEALDPPQRCRVCGCVETIACVQEGDESSACGWADVDLCTACAHGPEEAGKWAHPPREKTDPEYARLAKLEQVA
jgi:hypothetical protein